MQHLYVFLGNTCNTVCFCTFCILQTEVLENERERRKKDWTDFLARQHERCDQVDAEFSEQAEIVAKHYEDLEKNLTAMKNSTP
jgi:hypothetical protein